MVTRGEPIAVQAIEDPVEIHTTGFDNYTAQYTQLASLECADGNVTFPTDLPDELKRATNVYRPCSAAEIAAIQNKAVGATGFIASDDHQDNVALLKYLLNIARQAHAYNSMQRDNKKPSVHTPYDLDDDTADVPEFYAFTGFVKDIIMNGEMGPFVALQNLGGAGEVEDIMKLLDIRSNSDTGAGANKRHRAWMARLMLWMANAIELPVWTERYENRSEAQINAHVHDVASNLILAIADLPFLMSMASEATVFKMGYLDEGLMSKKVDKSKIFTAIDEVWKSYVARWSNVFAVPTGYTQLNNGGVPPIYSDLLFGTTMEDTINEIEDQFFTNSWSLKMARQLVGLAKLEFAGETHYIMSLFSILGAKNSTTNNAGTHTTGFGDIVAGAVHTHGQTGWTLGLELTACMEYFHYSAFRAQIYDAQFQRRKHWTYVDVSKIFPGSFSVNFSFTKSFMGIMSPGAAYAYYLLDGRATGSSIIPIVCQTRPGLEAATHADAFGQKLATDNTVLESVPKLVADKVIGGMPNMYYLFLGGLSPGINRKVGIYMGNKLTEEQINWDIAIGIIFGTAITTSAPADGNCKEFVKYIARWVDLRDYKKETTIGQMVITDGSNVIRCDLLKNRMEQHGGANLWAQTINKLSKHYYVTIPAASEISEESRPHGTHEPGVIPRLADNKEGIIARIISALQYNSKGAEAPKEVKTAPVKTTIIEPPTALDEKNNPANEDE